MPYVTWLMCLTYKYVHCGAYEINCAAKIRHFPWCFPLEKPMNSKLVFLEFFSSVPENLQLEFIEFFMHILCQLEFNCRNCYLEFLRINSKNYSLFSSRVSGIFLLEFLGNLCKSSCEFPASICGNFPLEFLIILF